MLQQISFTSYGRDTFSSISLLIDSICKRKFRVTSINGIDSIINRVKDNISIGYTDS